MNKDGGIKTANGFKNLKFEPDLPPKGFLHT